MIEFLRHIDVKSGTTNVQTQMQKPERLIKQNESFYL